ncbi:thiazolinyl imide reductase [Staphylococcus caprae M23864:W1]|nr:thiazolinyl imide reductase [Staphylococcus caprae M23864:W1]
MEGVHKYTRNYEIVGILSKGSKQSKKCSEKYQVPLYTNLNDIDVTKIDIVIIVIRSAIVGGKGSEIAKYFLNKGVHVIQEQPVHSDDIVQSLKTMRNQDCLYMINTFYPYIETVKKFIQFAQKISRKCSLKYIEASCSIQVLYPLLDILNQSLEGLSPASLHDKKIQTGFFTQVFGEIKNVPFDIKIQNQLDTSNPDNYFHIFHKITFYYESGRLTLNDTNQGVSWYPRVFIPNDEEGNLNLYIDNTLLNLPVSENINTHDYTYKNVYEEVWPRSIKNTIERFEDYIQKPKDLNVYLQQLFTLCQLWKEISQLIGPIETINGTKISSLTLNEIND